MMEVGLIKTPEDHAVALERIDAIWEAAQTDAHAADELKLLSILVEAYEKEVTPIPLPTPQEALRFLVEDAGVPWSHVAEAMGVSEEEAHDVARGALKLTLPMVRGLVKDLGMSADVLVQ